MLALRVIAVLFLAVFLTGSSCNRQVNLPAFVPAGPADIQGHFEILGVARRESFTGNIDSAGTGVVEVPMTVPVPVGTVHVIPVLDGWVLGHGTLDMSKPDWNSDDNSWGIGLAN